MSPASTNITLPTESISALLPHRPPMQLLDGVISCDEFSLLARARLRPGRPFCTNNGVLACIGLEYLGQATAAFCSISALQAAEGETSAPPNPPTPGMLIASRSYRCMAGFIPAPRDLLIAITLTSAGASAGLVKFSGTITALPAGALDALEPPTIAAEQAFAQGDLSVYLPPA